MPQNEPPPRRGPARDSVAETQGRVLIVGGRRQLRRLARGLDQGPCSGLPIVGFVDHSGRGRQLAVHPKSDPVPILGPVHRLDELVARTGATDLLIALPAHHRSRRLHQRLVDLAGPRVRVHWLDDPAGLGEPTTGPATSLARPTRSLRMARIAKRAVDFLGALAGLVLLSPLLLAVTAIIYLTSGRPIFYSQVRVGQGGRPFRIWKFRSMRSDAETRTGPIWATTDDQRCTPFGMWLRRTSVDELPQLFNVLIGEMSLVGPRPERPIFVDQFREALPDYDFRHAVPGGMTGWAQVHGWRGRTSLRKRLQYDLDYIRRWSFWIDIRILLMTIQHVGWGKTRWKTGPRRPI